MANEPVSPHRSPDTVEALEPTTLRDRIVVLDILRGFALLGILLVNILSFSGISSGSQQWAGYFDQAAQDFIQFFVRGKFLSLFGILFGLGLAMQIDRLGTKSADRHWIYGRRISVLFLFGALHLLLDPAEVLALYALCGALLILFHKCSPKALILWALLIMPLPYLHTAVISTLATMEPAAQTLEESGEVEAEPSQQVDGEEVDPDSSFSWNPYTGERAVRTYSSGDLSDVLTYNAQFSLNRWTSSWVNFLWMTVPLPLMLVGFLIGRSKILERQRDEIPLFRRSFWIGLGLGISGTWYSEVLFEQAAMVGWDPWLAFAGSVLWAIASLLMALGYAAGVVLLVQRNFWKTLLSPLQAVGRFALTNYLLQTLICTTIFYSYGIGLYGKVGPLNAVLIAIAIYLVQVLLSFVWAHLYRFGPAEWLWRSLTYGRLQPIRIT